MPLKKKESADLLNYAVSVDEQVIEDISWFDTQKIRMNQRCEVRICGLRLENFDGIRWWRFEIAGDYPALSKLSVFMRPQRIVSYLSLNVIIHLEVKLNYEKILEIG